LKYHDLKSTIGIKQAEIAKESAHIAESQDQAIDDCWLDEPAELVEGFSRMCFDAEKVADLNIPIVLDILSDKSCLTVPNQKVTEQLTKNARNNENVEFTFTLD
jgi:hypothetical protein